MKKAMIFCAGFGTRMKFLSEILPKALLPVLNIPLLDYIIFQLETLGFQDVMINIHHLGPLIQKHVKTRNWNINIHFSDEKEILGTGGGLKKVECFFENEKNFLVINSDCLSDFQFEEALCEQQKAKAHATLFIQKKQAGYSGLTLSSSSTIQNFDQGDFMFCGIHILTPEIFSYLDLKPSCIIQTGYKRMLEAGKKTQGFELKTTWYDFGTLELYRHHQFKILSQLSQEKMILRTQKRFFPGLHEFQDNIWFQSVNTQEINSNLKLNAPIFMGEKVFLGENCEIGPFAILGGKCRLGQDTKVHHSILFPKIKIQEHETISHQILG
ncbi:MAG: NDP-sugar synthase [Deltaproteobacteria bacterium]|nr:NDP-sugar synthase [Deltaproteobacteria bacterium]